MKAIARIALYTFIFLLLALMSSYITFRVMGAKKIVTVPELEGKSLIDANKEILTKRLYLKIEGEEFNAEIPVGNIIRQDIPPDGRIKEGRTIRVIMSKGPKRYYMPTFIGFNLDEARELALKNNIKIVQIVRVSSDSFDRDVIIAQRPTPEERGADKITLLVSEGIYQTLNICPDFTRMSLLEAKELSERMGLESELIGYGSKIVGQDPQPKVVIKRGDIIRLKLEHKEKRQLRWL